MTDRIISGEVADLIESIEKQLGTDEDKILAVGKHKTNVEKLYDNMSNLRLLNLSLLKKLNTNKDISLHLHENATSATSLLPLTLDELVRIKERLEEDITDAAEYLGLEL